MPKFDLYVVRPPEGMATITAIPESNVKTSEVALRRLSRAGCLVKSLGGVDLSFVKRSEAQMKLEFTVRNMFAASAYKPPVSIVW